MVFFQVSLLTSFHTENFQSYREAVTSLVPADPNSVPHGKFLFLLLLRACSQPPERWVQCLARKLTSNRKHIHCEALLDSMARRGMEVHLCRHWCLHAEGHTFSETAVKVMAWVISDSPKVSLSALFMFFMETPNTNSWS